MQQPTHGAPAPPRQQVVNQFESIKDFQTQSLRQQGQQPPLSSGSGVTSLAAAQLSEAAAAASIVIPEEEKPGIEEGVREAGRDTRPGGDGG